MPEARRMTRQNVCTFSLLALSGALSNSDIVIDTYLPTTPTTYPIHPPPPGHSVVSDGVVV
jgi:hypothetical protein